MSLVKQVIVLRKDLNMRKGKMVAQGAHASLGAYRKAKSLARMPASLQKEAIDWSNGEQTKICVGVESETELKEVFAKAEAAGLPAELILDAAHTEFKEPTYTAVGIGPAQAEEIDKITGHLKLL
jgi:peptidyl-tRNA hydrolase, PTH2 family